MLSIKRITIVLLGLLAGSCATLDEPGLQPVTPSASELQLMAQGNQLYQDGKYQDALHKVQEVLALNSGNVEALYAIASCYFELKDYQNSVSFSKQAARYKSDVLAETYLLLGANYERLDDPWSALRTYRLASEQFPRSAFIQYRLALAYRYLAKPEEAAEAFKIVLRLNARNPEPHFQLGMLYAEHGYRVPAVLALSTSLLLDPVNGPVTMMHDTIEHLLTGRVTHGKTPERIHEFPVSAKTDEGDFTAIDKALFEQHTMSRTDSTALLKSQYRVLFAQLSKPATAEKSGRYFVEEYYVPFYQQLARDGLAETAINWMFQAKQGQKFNQQLDSAPSKKKRLAEFIKNYKWPETNALK